MFLYAATILLSAFLLFLVQPVIAKQILPWFGGSAAVWSTCMVFFQALLLGGYAYAHWLSGRRRPRVQGALHIALLLASLALLPIIPSANWKPDAGADPLWRILGLLAATIGLPYFLLSSTGPLVQNWVSGAAVGPAQRERVYRLFALSNFGSLAGLLAYPFLVEPNATAQTQSWIWSGAYALFVLVCAGCAWRARGQAPVVHASTAAESAPALARIAFWTICAALGSVLLLAVTSHITQNIASIPFLWVLPLSLYLLSFVVCFEGRGGRGWYARRWWLVPVLVVSVAMAWGLSAEHGVLDLHVAVPLYSAGLFLVCVFCHGELAASKPAAVYLTRFYLAMSAGGAAGGLLVALVAPHVFNAYFELPLALLGLTLVALWVSRGARPWLALCAIAVVATGWFGWRDVKFLTGDTLMMSRNFYGTLRVKQTEAGPYQTRRLLHGVILHGEQYTDAARSRIPTTYYAPSSGVGLALLFLRDDGDSADDQDAAHVPLRVGLVGMGTGTLAAYGKPGDVFRIYELDPDVPGVARTWFHYLADSKARIETVLGDARLSMERELAQGSQRYDVIVIDAFSSDSIPVHLITREALALYSKHLKPDGVIAFHVSNRFLDLPPVVRGLADDAGYTALLISDEPDDDRSFSHTDWVLVTRNQEFLAHEEVAPVGTTIAPQAGLRLWTDQFNNLFQILK